MFGKGVETETTVIYLNDEGGPVVKEEATRSK